MYNNEDSEIDIDIVDVSDNVNDCCLNVDNKVTVESNEVIALLTFVELEGSDEELYILEEDEMKVVIAANTVVIDIGVFVTVGKGEPFTKKLH